jgi:hypothetical protein
MPYNDIGSKTVKTNFGKGGRMVVIVDKYWLAV